MNTQTHTAAHTHRQQHTHTRSSYLMKEHSRNTQPSEQLWEVMNERDAHTITGAHIHLVRELFLNTHTHTHTHKYCVVYTSHGTGAVTHQHSRSLAYTHTHTSYSLHKQ